MALKLHLQESVVGVPFQEAYAKIISFSGTAISVDYRIVVFASADARATNSREVAGYSYRYEGDLTGNMMDLLYADLKTRPGFENAEDC